MICKACGKAFDPEDLTQVLYHEQHHPVAELGIRGHARREFEMTDADLAALYEACRPLPYIIAGGMPPTSVQERANTAWARLGERMGFDWKTVEPSTKGDRFFTAVERAVEA